MIFTRRGILNFASFSRHGVALQAANHMDNVLDKLLLHDHLDLEHLDSYSLNTGLSYKHVMQILLSVLE